MTHEERLALARAIWPGHADELAVAPGCVMSGRGHLLLHVDHQHPRANAALDVALLELARWKRP